MSDERVRLFVALELPDEVREALVGWGASLRLQGLRVLGVEALHVTLCFLGWQAAEAARPIAAACRALSAGPPPLALGEPIWLAPRRPRVLAVGLVDCDGALARLQADVADRLQKGGWYVPERRSYMAHVTVARVRRGATIKPGPLPPPAPLSFRASVVTLFRSRLSPGGAQYEPVASVGLD